ncbi:response regulator [Sphingomicrobium astaxanthinifaciens]|uniref:response regulator n=1 Tax=Sphingomicrobium astaxanthinifaciens TaxID=1227949 RepID=UPI001FCB95AD|nr:response regulator [Sphingomicrobium astaxanthinifaciens]MCJ7420347.1 response regulator [Sphingomicrobium astaxanthinifaciens]
MARRPRLLLIDDEPALAAFLADAARLSAFEPVIATDHHDFREIFRNEPPDMVAIDLGMPGMDGVELLRFLAEHEAKQPVLIVSGFEPRVVDTAFRLGHELGLKMVGPLNKPARLSTLESLLAKVRERLVA